MMNGFEVFELVSIVGNIAWVAVACPGLHGLTEPISEMGLWSTCVISIFVNVCFAKLPQNTAVAVIGGVLGGVYLGFNIAGWVIKGIKKEDIMNFVNEIFLSLQSVGRFLMIPALIRGTNYITQVIEVTLDGLCIVCSLVGLGLEIDDKNEMADTSIADFGKRQTGSFQL